MTNHRNFKGFCICHAINEFSFLQASLQSTYLTANNTTATDCNQSNLVNLCYCTVSDHADNSASCLCCDKTHTHSAQMSTD